MVLILAAKSYLLLYADDIVIIAENESDLQIQLDFINQWCKKWRLNINHNKSNVIHFRKRNDRQSNFIFLFGHYLFILCKHIHT